MTWFFLPFSMAVFAPKFFRLTSRPLFPSLTPTSIVSRLQYQQTHLKPFHSTLPRKMESNNDQLQLGNLFDLKGKVALVTGGGE